jgi:hypothetical protein
MTNYARLSEKPIPFLSLTAYPVAEFQALLPPFRTAFLKQMQKNTLDAKKRAKRRFVAYRNSPLPTMEDKLLFILMYLRKATPQDIFGEVFSMPQPVANKWIQILHPGLPPALAELKELPARPAPDLELPQAAGQVFFQDGSARALERPKAAQAQTTFYRGKRKRHAVKNNVLANASAKIILLTPTCEGKKPDKKIADETQLTLPNGSYRYQDPGFQGDSLADVTILQPLKKPRGRALTSVEKENNREISRIRIRVEHAIAGVKRYRIVKDQLRTRKDDFRDRAMETCCGLHNFRLNFRPWNYASNIIKS